jgi:hypothetical protein
VPRHKRVSNVGVDGFRRFAELLAIYDQIVVTPHSLTEAWNLAGNDRSSDQVVHATKLHLQLLIKGVVEVYTPARDLLSKWGFPWLGLSDVAQIEAAKHHACPLVSADRELCATAAALSLVAIDLNEITGSARY